MAGPELAQLAKRLAKRLDRTQAKLNEAMDKLKTLQHDCQQFRRLAADRRNEIARLKVQLERALRGQVGVIQ
jgi:predicted nuclease with TOPRIM domain